MRISKILAVLPLALFAAFLHGAAAVEPAQRLRCGVIAEPLDWNKQDLHGGLLPLDTEICRAIATARFGAPDRVDIQTYNVEQDGLSGLAANRSEVIVGVTPQAAASARGVRFSIPFFQDGQGFLVHKDEGIHDVPGIAGRKLCYIEDTDNDPTVLSYLAARAIRPIPFGFQEEGEMDAAMMDRHCQVTSAYISKLAEARSTFRNSREYVFLPELLSLMPVTVAATDARLAAIANATISALLQAEYLGVTQAGTAHAGHSEDKRMQRLTGEDWITAQGLGLPHDWSLKLVAAMGNYAEIYDRTVGPATAMGLPRGVNALWNQGGVLAPLSLQ